MDDRYRRGMSHHGGKRAGYYDLVKHTGAGTLNGNPITKTEYDPFENGDLSPQSGTYTFTDHYEYAWVADNNDIVADPPVEKILVATATVSWGPAATGAWEQECSTEANASSDEDTLSSSWSNTIAGQGGGQVSGGGGGLLSKTFVLDGATPILEVTWALSTVRSGYNPAHADPYWDYASLMRDRPKEKYCWFVSPGHNPANNVFHAPPNTTQMPITFNGGWRFHPGASGIYRVVLGVWYPAQSGFGSLGTPINVAGPIFAWGQTDNISYNQQQTRVKASLQHSYPGLFGWVPVDDDKVAADTIAIWVN